MPPKIKITKEAIIQAALDTVRKHGIEALNARDLAAALGCSTQPIFSNFASMEEVRQAVLSEAQKLYEKQTEEEMTRGEFPPYKASGMAYIRFASEEKELFKLLFMRDRADTSVPVETEFDNSIISLVQNNTGFDRPNASLFHLEMWIFVHGIAAMAATGYLAPDRELVSRMLTESYQGLKKYYEEKE